MAGCATMLGCGGIPAIPSRESCEAMLGCGGIPAIPSHSLCLRSPKASTDKNSSESFTKIKDFKICFKNGEKSQDFEERELSRVFTDVARSFHGITRYHFFQKDKKSRSVSKMVIHLFNKMYPPSQPQIWHLPHHQIPDLSISSWPKSKEKPWPGATRVEFPR